MMEEFRKQLVDIINASELPFEATFYVVKDVFREINDVYKDMLEKQKEEVNKEQEAKEEDKKDEAE